jgi:photosystem II stability/assembly factor-like uncharacterized protein|nr:MAG: hypothetical protein KatS3mg041_0473 [Bacteroidota bacterium]
MRTPVGLVVLFALSACSLYKEQSPEKPDPQVHDVLYAENLFIAVGERGLLLTSADGLTWTRRASPTQSTLHGIAYGEGRFVAVGEGGSILTSEDGISWKRVSSPDIPAEPLYGVAYGNGRFLAVGRMLLLSMDRGESWRPLGWGTQERVRFCGTFLAVGTTTVGPLAYGTIFASADGLHWEIRYRYLLAGLRDIACGPVPVAVGMAPNGQAIFVASDPEGYSWQGQPSPLGRALERVGYAEGRFLAVGRQGSVLTSGDGLTWEGQSLGEQWDLSALAYGAGRWVAFAHSGRGETRLFFSLDGGRSWQSRALAIGAP